MSFLPQVPGNLRFVSSAFVTYDDVKSMQRESVRLELGTAVTILAVNDSDGTIWFLVGAQVFRDLRLIVCPRLEPPS